MYRRDRNPLAVVAIFLLGLACLIATAKASDPLIEDLKSRLEGSDLAQEQKDAIVVVLDRAESQTQEAITKEKSAGQDAQRLADVEKTAKSIGEKLSDNVDVELTSPISGSLGEMEAELAKIEAQLSAAKQAVDKAEQEMSRATQRSAEIDSEIPKLKSLLDERKGQIAAATEDDGIESEINALDLKASERLFQARLVAVENEKALLTSQIAVGLPQLNRDLAAKELETVTLRYEQFKQAVEKRRSADAVDQVEAAKGQLDSLHPALRVIGERNQELAKINLDLAADIRDIEGTLEKRTVQLDSIREDFRLAESRVETVGLTDAVGALLRTLKQTLPSVGIYRMRLRQRAPTINDVQYSLLELTDERNAKLELQIDQLLNQSAVPVTYEDRPWLRDEAKDFLRQQRVDFLDPAIRNQTTYFNALVSLSTTEREIVDLVEDSTQYVNERVLWVRSTKPLPTQLIPGPNEWWFLSWSSWTSFAKKLGNDLKDRWASWMIAAAAFFVLMIYRSRLRRHIEEIGHQAGNSNMIRFRPTFRTLLLTIATSAPLPLFFWFIGKRFDSIAGTEPGLLAISAASQTIAWSYFPVELLRQICRREGLAESHFDWPSAAVTTLRRNLRWVSLGTIPLMTFSRFLGAGSAAYGQDSLQRYAFLGGIAALCVFVARTFHPRRGVAASYLAEHPDKWSSKLSVAWYFAAIAIPASLGLMTIVGYFFTAEQLGWRFFLSCVMLLVIVIAVSMVARWTLIHRRQLRMEEARDRRSQLAESDGNLSETVAALAAESNVDLQDQVLQTRRVFRAVMLVAALIGMWVVWNDVVPAFNFLEQWPTYTSTTTITEEIPGDDGKLASVTRTVPDPVTLVDWLLAIIAIGVTVVAVRNLPGLLEFAVLRRLPLDRSVRYATTTVVSYAIVLLGIILSCRQIGLHWQQVQWMATALTFGLAFGLQEMFANFVAGIIILFEQPVRVGDVVEIDGVTGVVSKIRIRATTITDWDRKDYIVPNKEFITGKLLNWTRSDEITRLNVKVGIAYGSDTERAGHLLLEAAKGHPDILPDPPTMAVFDGFGDSCLEFTLRFFIGNYERRNHVIHDLHMKIDRLFREAEIEISFPQRDLHLRTVPEGMERFFAETMNQPKEKPDG